MRSAAIPFARQPEVIAQLRENLRRCTGDGPPADAERLSTGCSALNDLLPGCGLRPGTVIEWLSPGPGSGVSRLALAVARQAMASGGAVVLCDRERALYPPALVTVCADLGRIILVRAPDAAGHRWAIHQALRSPAVAVVWARLDRIDDKTSRRFQLAAEAGKAIGIFIRPATIQGLPTWAEVQLRVEPLAGQRHRAWRLECVRARGPTKTTSVEIEWDETTGLLRAMNRSHETHPLPVASGLVRATRA